MPETKYPKRPYEPPKVTVDKTTVKDTIIMTKVQSMFPANVVYIGPISGERYIFPGAGSILEVDSRDVPNMLAYRIGTSACCGGGGSSDGNHVFQLV